MPAYEYARWRAYYQVEPFGTRREDWHHAKTQTTISNGFNSLLYAQGATRGKPQAAKVSDFTNPRKKTEPQKLQSFAAGWRALALKAKAKAKPKDV